jgi:mRNA interferase HicA
VTEIRDLETHLRAHGRALLREGGRHSIWLNPATETRTSVPRHREIPRTTARAICRRLGVPDVE